MARCNICLFRLRSKKRQKALLAGCGSLKDDVNAVTVGCCTFATHQSSEGILI